MTFFLAASTVHLPDLISDLGLILITAAIAVLLFRIMKQPLVLGYLVAATERVLPRWVRTNAFG